MKQLRLETIFERVFGMTGRGHEGRVQALEKAAGLAGGLGIPYALLRGGATLPAGPTSDKYWWDMLPPTGGGGDFTNAPAVFSNPTYTITAGAGNVNSGAFHGLAIATAGMYVAVKTIQILSLYNDTTLRAITIYQAGPGFPSYTSDMVFGDQNHINQGHGHHFEVWSYFGASAGANLLASANSESSAYGCIVSLFVLRIDPGSIQL